MIYRVTKQYGRGGETLVSQFSDINTAKKLIHEKLVEDVRYKLKVTYRLWEGMDLLEEFTDADVQQTSSSSGSGSGSGTDSSSGSGKRSSFQPTPFNAAPRPSGMPHNWIKDDDDQDDEKK